MNDNCSNSPHRRYDLRLLHLPHVALSLFVAFCTLPRSRFDRWRQSSSSSSSNCYFLFFLVSILNCLRMGLYKDILQIHAINKKNFIEKKRNIRLCLCEFCSHFILILVLVFSYGLSEVVTYYIFSRRLYSSIHSSQSFNQSIICHTESLSHSL